LTIRSHCWPLLIPLPPTDHVDSYWVAIQQQSEDTGNRLGLFRSQNEANIELVLASNVEPKSYNCTQGFGQDSKASWYTRHIRDALKRCIDSRSLLQQTSNIDRDLHEQPHIWRLSPLVLRIVMTHDGLKSPRSRPINVNSHMQGHDFGRGNRADVIFSGFVR
jgi:hypothetical protein